MLLMMVWLAACTFTFTNDLVTSHPDEVEAFANETVQNFYMNETEALIEAFAEDVDVSEVQMEAVYDFVHSSAEPERKKVIDRSTKTINGVKYFTSVYGIPRINGREDVTLVIVLKEDEMCCDINSLNFNARIGDAFLMSDSE